MNKKAFTLVELLAVITILGILMVIAIPNTISIIDKGKKDTFIADAKKFISLAEYKVAVDPTKKPTVNKTTNIFLSEVDYTDVLDTPDGNKYDINTSKVIVRNIAGNLEYYVILKPDKGRGVDLADLKTLSGSSKYKCIKDKAQIINTNYANLCK